MANEQPTTIVPAPIRLARRRLLDPKGMQFGGFRVISEVPGKVIRGQSVRMVLAECVCGKQQVRQLGQLMASKRIKSCGCLPNPRGFKHGLTPGSGEEVRRDYLWTTWSGIKARCFNPKRREYPRYGGRGITLHPAWVNDAAAFVSYIRSELGDRPSSRHSLDRIENDGNYEPGNLRWATMREQCANRHTRNKGAGVAASVSLPSAVKHEAGVNERSTRQE